MARQTDLRVKLSGDSSQLESAFKSAEAAAKVIERGLQKQEREAQRVREEWGKLGQGVLTAGTVMAAGLALATRAAIQWESAFAGVRKTVDGTEQQYVSIAAGLRQLATETTSSAVEIAAVAEAAGQLGVEADSVVGFTRTMVQLGDTTNLSATEAATAIARLHNIMGVLNSEAGRTGAAIVELGNNFATTEQEIVSMALRIAGAGRNVGLSTDEVLGLSAALSSVGISAELGGTNISKAMTIINSSVQAGGKEMRAFADIAGLAADEFAAKWREDPAAALDLFVQGLADVQSRGGDTAAVLSDLGFTGSEMQRVMLGLAGGADLVSEALDTSNTAWEESTALIEEAQKRYSTTEATLQQSLATINDAAISLGENLAPAVAATAERLSALVGLFTNLPGPLRATAAGLGAAAAAAAILAGGALVLVPRIAALNAALLTMGPRGVAAAGALSRLGTLLTGPWGLAIAGGTVLLGAFIDSQARKKAAVDAARQAIQADTGAIKENTREYVANELVQRGIIDAIDDLGISHHEALEAALGNADAMARINERAVEIRGNLEGLPTAGYQVAGEEDVARAFHYADAIQELADEIDAAKVAEEQFNTITEAGTDITAEAAEGMGVLSGAAGDSEQAMTDLDEAIQGLLDTLFGVASAEDDFRESLLSVEEAVFSVADAQKLLAEARKEHGASSREAREAEIALERANISVNKALEDSTSSALQYGRELIKTDGFTKATSKTIEAMAKDLEAQAIAAGKSEEEARALGDSVRDIPREAETAFIMNGLETSVSRVTDLRRAIETVPGRRTVYFNVVQQGDAPGGLGFTSVGQAQGSILHTAASGLITRGIATIAPANSNVLFAETPATGPEAYIPLGGAFRSRARQIHAEAGKYLGERQGMSVSVKTDGTEAAERIAAAVVTRTAEHAAVAHAWGAGL